MFAILGIPLQKQLGLSETEFGLIASMPVLTGSLVRVPLGMWTDRFGGRIVFFLTMLACVIPIYLMSYATQYWHFLAIGLFVGLAGGSLLAWALPCSKGRARARRVTRCFGDMKVFRGRSGCSLEQKNHARFAMLP